MGQLNDSLAHYLKAVELRLNAIANLRTLFTISVQQK